jgi:hypothetical protein
VNSQEIESRDPRSSTGRPYRLEIVLPSISIPKWNFTLRMLWLLAIVSSLE